MKLDLCSLCAGKQSRSFFIAILISDNVRVVHGSDDVPCLYSCARSRRAVLDGGNLYISAFLALPSEAKSDRNTCIALEDIGILFSCAVNRVLVANALNIAVHNAVCEELFINFAEVISSDVFIHFGKLCVAFFLFRNVFNRCVKNFHRVVVCYYERCRGNESHYAYCRAERYFFVHFSAP